MSRLMAEEYKRFEDIKRIRESGHNSSSDFAEVSKIVEAGAASKPILDYELSRYACYLIVQNVDHFNQLVKIIGAW